MDRIFYNFLSHNFRNPRFAQMGESRIQTQTQKTYCKILAFILYTFSLSYIYLFLFTKLFGNLFWMREICLCKFTDGYLFQAWNVFFLCAFSDTPNDYVKSKVTFYKHCIRYEDFFHWNQISISEIPDKLFSELTSYICTFLASS